MNRSTMARSCFLIGTTLFWLFMTARLIHQEFFQLSPVKAPYEVLPILSMQVREEYRGIYLGDELIGFTSTALKEKKQAEAPPSPPSYAFKQTTYMTFRFLGREREMLVRTGATLDHRLELESFKLKVKSGEYWTEMEGNVEGNTLKLQIRGQKGTPVDKEISIKRPLFYSEALSMIWTPENIRTGKQGNLHLWNPLILGFEDVRFRVGKKTTINHDGRQKQVYLIRLAQDNVETRYWTTPEGVVLRHESPTGLVMIKQEAWKIFDNLREKRQHLPDLPNLYSVSSDRIFDNPSALSYLKIKVKTPGDERTLTLQKPSLEALYDFTRPIEADEKLRPYLEATEFIQSNAPEIRQKAEEIAGREQSALKASLKLMQWVHEWITPTPTVSLPSALQVYELKRGDCNEYTALFTALARSLGIPTRMKAGLVYQGGRFFYHAWPEIYVGEWVGLDPTFNQAPADVTHIPLAEGGLKEQAALAHQLGKVTITVLEAGSYDDHGSI